MPLVAEWSWRIVTLERTSRVAETTAAHESSHELSAADAPLDAEDQARTRRRKRAHRRGARAKSEHVEVVVMSVYGYQIYT